MIHQFDIVVSDLQATDLSACFSHDVGNLVSRNVLLVPAGQVESSNGDFILDRRGADQAIAAFKSSGVCIHLDFHHQSNGGRFCRTRRPRAGGRVGRLYVLQPQPRSARQDRMDGPSDSPRRQGQEVPLVESYGSS